MLGDDSFDGWRINDAIPSKWHRDRARQITEENPALIEELQKPFPGTIIVMLFLVTTRLCV